MPMAPDPPEKGSSPSIPIHRSILRLLSAIDAITRLDGWLGAFCLFALTAFMIAGLVVRLFSTFVPWLPTDLPIAWEYSSYLMAATFTFGAAMTLRSGAHIRVRIVVGRLSPQANRIHETLLSLVAAVFTAFFTWSLFHFTLSAYAFGENSIASETPLWIPKGIITFGVFLMSLQFVARSIRAMLGVPLDIAPFEVSHDADCTDLRSNSASNSH